MIKLPAGDDVKNLYENQDIWKATIERKGSELKNTNSLSKFTSFKYRRVVGLFFIAVQIAKVVLPI